VWEKSNNKWLIPVVIAFLIIALGSGYYFYKKFNSEKTAGNVSEKSSSATTAASSDKSAEKPKETTSASSASDLKKADTYLPGLNKKYTYKNNYVDGTSDIVDIITGHIEGAAVMSMTNIIHDSEAYTEHIVRRSDGLYTVSDENTAEYVRYLPDTISKGLSWESSGIAFKIEETNASCKTGLKSFENCIVVNQNYSGTGYATRVWYAPGIGIVKAVYTDSGSVRQELTGIFDVNESEAKELILKYSLNIGKVK
ncbi:MAG: hypothetical protein ABRQ27_12980, partial [Clostridiaceae bacterium]